MTASDTHTKIERHASLEGYSNFVNLVASNQPHPELVPLSTMCSVLEKALADQELVDQAKKALMYGKDRDLIRALREAGSSVASGPRRQYPSEDLADGLDRLHAVLGMRTEADELLKLELLHLYGEPISNDERLDEAGDLQWYWQLYANALDTSWFGVVSRNIAKLLKRFPNLTFEADKAIDRDKEAESRAQLEAAT